MPNGIEVASIDTRGTSLADKTVVSAHGRKFSDVVAAIGIFTGVGTRDETDKFKGVYKITQPNSDAYNNYGPLVISSGSTDRSEALSNHEDGIEDSYCYV
jgi:hypothetical protein